MSLVVLHSSDLHGAYKRLIQDHADTPFDVWVDTGDFLATAGRRKTGHIEAPWERAYQLRWLAFKKLRSRVAEWLHGRPAVMVQGNHDFISFPDHLRAVKADVHTITPEGIQCLGRTWAGFREVNWIAGEWMGENYDFNPLVDWVFNTNPDILVTHAPPAGILDEEEGYGIRPLTSALTYREHKIKTHFFGHCHRSYGHETQMDIDFYNGAEHATVVEIP